MTQNAPTQSQYASLPNLVKFYLVQLYPLAFTLLLSRVIFGFVGIIEGIPDATAWSLGFGLIGAASIIIIVGLHTRAAWAPLFAARLNKALALFGLIVGIRIFMLVVNMQLSPYGMFRGTQFFLLAPSLFALNIPIFWAWSRYFTVSQKVASVFGSKLDQEEGKVPSWAVGFLRVICAAYITFFSVFILLCAVINGKDLLSKNSLILLVCLLPQTVFPLLLLFFTTYKGATLKRLTITLVAFVVFIRLWTRVPYILIDYFTDFLESCDLYLLFSDLSLLPLPAMVLLLVCGLLTWKIWSDPKEQSWFAGSNNLAYSPSPFTIYSIVLLHYSLNIFISYSYGLFYALSNEDSPQVFDIIAMLLCVASCALHIALLYTQVKKRGDVKRLALLAFAGSFVLFFVGTSQLIADLFGENASYSYYALVYSISAYLAPLGVSIFALLHWRFCYKKSGENAMSIFKLSTPYLLFLLLCIVVMFGGLSEKIAQVLLPLINPTDYLWQGSAELGLELFFMHLEYLAAYLVCPLLAIRWLKDGLKKPATFYALCTFWIFTLIFSAIGDIASARELGSDIFRMNISQIIGQVRQLHIYSIIAFMLYYSSASKKDCTGNVAKADEGLAN